MFQHRIKELRLEKRYTQQDVADKLGITRPAYTAYESGKRQPDFEILKSLSSLFDVTTDYLLGIENTKAVSKSANAQTIAAHIDDDVSEEEMKEIMNYIDYIKQKHKAKE